MPWSSNQGGGGGPWGGGGSGGGGGGGGGQSPWGRPSGGGPFGQRPPDIEDLIRRGQDRVKQIIPGGFGSGKGFLLAGVAVLAVWLATGIYTVRPDEQGVVLRFGKWVDTTGPGLNYHLPVPIETVLKPRVTFTNSLDIGFRSSTDPRTQRQRAVPEEALMLTGDENIVDIQYTVFWKIQDAGKFLFNIASPEGTVKAAAESAMREVVGTLPVSFVLAEGRAKVEQDAQKLLQEVLDSYGAGVQIQNVQLRTVDPPAQVIDAFRDVQRAKADRERARNESEAYRNDIVPRARGEAQRLIQESEAYRQQAIAQARGEAERFLSVYNAYRLAPEVTKQRLYLETMEQVLRGSNKVIIDQNVGPGGQGVVPYLPLPEVQRRVAPPAPGASPAQPTSGGAQQGVRP